MSKGIYILGGMGPQASGELYRLLTVKAQANYGAADNDDYPEVTIHSIPIPDFISDESKEPEALTMLAERVAAIPADFYDVFAIACNTAHLLAPELTAKTPLAFVSMIDGVADRVASTQATTVGLLASPVTIRTGLYQTALEKRGVRLITPDTSHYEAIEPAIRAVIANGDVAAHKAKLEAVAEQLRADGAERIVLGCTELPLVFGDTLGDDIVSSLDVLSDDLLKFYYR